jgi:retron-type reverse transcriptase
MDLHDFFGSIRTWRVRSLMMIAGYSPAVATCIAQLCTAAPLADLDAPAALRHSRLPQGAPTSPAVANVAAFRLDRRLAGLSDTVGGCYTRYADDLIFSGGTMLARRSQRLATSVAAIAMDEGFSINFRKTVTMRRSDRQQVLGLVVNERISTPRRQYETLKAILTNCIRHGQQSQNRDQHPRFRDSLRGRIAHVAAVHPQRGEKLLRCFDQIDWSD